LSKSTFECGQNEVNDLLSIGTSQSEASFYIDLDEDYLLHRACVFVRS